MSKIDDSKFLVKYTQKKTSLNFFFLMIFSKAYCSTLLLEVGSLQIQFLVLSKPIFHVSKSLNAVKKNHKINLKSILTFNATSKV